jgi:hypothetical protein
MVQKQ